MIYNGPVENIKNGEWEKFGTPAILSPDASQKGLMKIVGGKVKLIPIDLAFPVLHGKYGEDGTIQGLFELAQIPYVGNGVLASSVSMDKVFTKIVAKNARIPQAKYVEIRTEDVRRIKTTASKIEKKLGYPCFVKPANAGSSVGITKAHNKEELMDGLRLAAEHDNKIVVEEGIVGREIECAVLGNREHVEASCVGEIFAAAEFYDYDAKYNNSDSKTVVPAEISSEKQDEIRKMAIKVFKAVDGSGLRTVEGLLTIGHEVRSLEVEGDTCDYWIVDKTGGELYRQYDSLTLGVKNGQTVYARLQVVDGGNAGEGFAEGYDKILQVVGVDSLQSL